MNIAKHDELCENDKPVLETLALVETLVPVLNDPQSQLNISFRLAAPVPMEYLVLHPLTDGGEDDA